MWILPVLSFALIVNGGLAQIPPMMIPFLASQSGGRSGGGLDIGTMMMMQNPEAAGPLMAMKALGSGGGNGLANLALMNPEALAGMIPGGAGMNPAMMYYMLSQNQEPTTTPVTPTGRPTGNATRPTTKTTSTGPDMSNILQMMALSGGEMGNLGAMAALMSGRGNNAPPGGTPKGPTISPMQVMSPEQYRSLLTEGAGAHPTVVKRLCAPLQLRCKANLMTLMCPDKVTLYDPDTYYVCPKCPVCRHQLMMNMINPGAGQGQGARGRGQGGVMRLGARAGGIGGPPGGMSQLVSSLMGKRAPA